MKRIIYIYDISHNGSENRPLTHPLTHQGLKRLGKSYFLTENEISLLKSEARM